MISRITRSRKKPPARLRSYDEGVKYPAIRKNAPMKNDWSMRRSRTPNTRVGVLLFGTS